MQNDIILTRWMFCVLYGHVFLCSLRVPGPKYVHPALALNRSLTLSLYIKKSPHTIIIGHSKSLSERLANIMGFNFVGVNRMKRGPYSGLCVYWASACAREYECAFWVLYSVSRYVSIVWSILHINSFSLALFVCLKWNATLPLRYATMVFSLWLQCVVY